MSADSEPILPLPVAPHPADMDRRGRVSECTSRHGVYNNSLHIIDTRDSKTSAAGMGPCPDNTQYTRSHLQHATVYTSCTQYSIHSQSIQHATLYTILNTHL